MVFGLFGNKKNSSQTTSTSTVNDNRVGVSDNGVLVGEGAIFDASTVLNDQDTTSLTTNTVYQSAEALAVAGDATTAAIEAQERALATSLDFGGDLARSALGTSERALTAATAAIGEANAGSTAAIERISAQAIESAQAAVTEGQAFALDQLGAAAAASRSGSDEIQVQTINAVKLIGLAVAAALAFGALR